MTLYSGSTFVIYFPKRGIPNSSNPTGCLGEVSCCDEAERIIKGLYALGIIPEGESVDILEWHQGPTGWSERTTDGKTWESIYK